MKTYMLEKLNDIEAIRSINAAMVLNALRKSGPLSRPELAKELNLSKVTISNIIFELNDAQLTCEAGLGSSKSKGGRKPLLVQLNLENKRVLAAHLRQGELMLGLVDISGRFISKTNVEAAGREAEQFLVEAVEFFLAESGIEKDAVLGLGLALDEDAVSDGDGESLPSRITARLALPVDMESSVRAAALGERWFGAGRKSDDFFYIHSRPRLAAALIMDGALSDCPAHLEAVRLPLDVDASLRALSSCERGRDDGSLAFGLGLVFSALARVVGLRSFILGDRPEPSFVAAVSDNLNLSAPDLVSSLSVRVGDFSSKAGLMGAAAMALDTWVYHSCLISI